MARRDSDRAQARESKNTMTYTISFRGLLDSISTWGLVPGSSAMVVQPATGIVLAQGLPISDAGHFSAAIDASAVGRLVAALARLGRSSAVVELEVRVQAPDGTGNRGIGSWTPTSEPVRVAFRLAGTTGNDYEIYGVIDGDDVRRGAIVEVLTPGSPDFVTVGRTTLRDDGAYRLEYTALGSPSGPDSPLLIRVRQDQRVVHESGALCSVPAVFQYDATVGEESAGPSTFSRIASAPLPSSDGVLSDAELAAVACRLRVDADDVRRYHLAENLVRTRFSGVSREVAFGVAHGAGVEAESQFLALDPRALERHWQRARDVGAVSKGSVDELSSLANQLVDAHLAADTRSPLGEVVERLGLISVTPREFLGQLLYDFTGSRQDYLADFQREAPKEDAEVARFAFELWPLIGDTELLLHLLQKRDSTTSTPEDVAAFGQAQWVAYLKDIGREETSRAAVAEAYAAALEHAYPTHAALYRLEAQGLFRAASSYLRANPSLNILEDRIREFVGRDASTTASVDAIEELETVQRLIRIVPTVGASDSVREVVSANYRSALAIAKTPWAQFRGSFSPSSPDEKFRSIYKGARRVAMWVLHATVSVQQSRASTNFKVLIPDEAEGGPIDLRGLFDALDSCACEPCRSVLSPAAYLVALLEFVRDHVSATAYDELLARRPWIADTLLDCANAQTPVSKVDLINELLEAEVNPPGSVSAPQTTWTAERLQAEPEHLDRDAYGLLATASAYPWDLPFDLNAEEIATLLEPVGSVWGELLGAFEDTDNAAVRAAWLRTSSEALALIEADAVDQQMARWDGAFPSPNVPGGVMAFLRTTRSDLAHFERLAHTWFVGRFGLAMDWAAEGDPCHLEDARLQGSSTFEACMVAAERFERLRRATGWSVHALDEALQAFARSSVDGHIPARSTTALADLERLHHRFDTLEISELVAWFRVPTHPRRPGGDVAFERLFGEPDRFDVIGGEETEWLEVVAGAIGTEVAIVEQLFGEGGEVEAGALPLSRFWGLQGLAKAIGVPLADLAAFVRLSGVHPFGSGPGGVSEANLADAPAAVLTFLELWDQWASANASVAEVSVALDMNSSQAVTEAAQFYAALRRARQDVAASIEPDEAASTADRLERLLPRLLGATPAAELLDALLHPADAELLGAEYPDWVDVAAINAVLQAEPLDLEAMSHLGVEIATRAASELGANERAIALAKVARQLVEGSFSFEGEAGVPTPTTDDRRLLGRARLLRALAPLELDAAWLQGVLSEPPGWLSASMLDGSEATDLSSAFSAWLEIAVLVVFDRRLDGAFLPVLGARLDGVTEGSTWSAQLGALLSMNEEDVEAALPEGPSLPPTAAELARLQLLQRHGERVGASVSRMQRWATEATATTSPSDATVQSVREAVRSRFEPSTWFAMSAASRNQLRVRQRDALVAYLTTRGSARQPGRDVSTVQRLSDALLIDVQSEACQTTSRIVEATLAVQLFVFRIQLRLEDVVHNLPESASRHWAWMKNYRVWEAAKKIFLFPENYLESEFRADKTPLFDDFVSTLGSGKIDEELAERAFTAYAEGLHAVSFLRPAGIVYDFQHEDPAKKVTHVVAHDRSNPPTYYHRQQVLGRWSPWEEIPGAMPNTGVLPVVRRGRLSLYWPSVEPKDVPSASLSEDAPPPQSARVALAWMERTGEGWQAERRSVPVLNADHHVIATGRRRYFSDSRIYGLHQAADDPGALVLSARGASRHNIYELGRFRSRGCAGQWRAEPRSGYVQTRVPGNTNRTGQRFEFWSEHDLAPQVFVDAGMDLGNGIRLTRTPRTFEYVFQRKGADMTRMLPFLFTDDDRSFLVRVGQRRASPVPRPGPVAYTTSLDGVFMENAGGTVALAALGGQSPSVEEQHQPLGWRFEAFSHELICDVVQALRERGVEGVFEPQLPSVLGRQVGYQGDVLEDWYQPTDYVIRPFPELTFDFDPSSAYGTYNWELFFHAPAHTALQLVAQGRFEQAQQWWHYIFNPQQPFGNSPSGPRRFWRVKPLAEEPQSIEEILRNLAAGSEGDDDLRRETVAALDDWIDHPFDAHAVAARRPGAYQRWVVARYLDLLIAWGDSLYRQDTRESVNEAAQLYMIAGQLLGPKPERLPAQEFEARTYAQIRDQLDESGNALVALENVAPLPVMSNALTAKTALPKAFAAFPQALSTTLAVESPLPAAMWFASEGQGDAATEATTSFAGPPRLASFSKGEDELEVPVIYNIVDDFLLGIWADREDTRKGLYFCIPPNPVFEQYWDAVGQRLFNIRNCRDLDGNIRELGLFAPPIDPKLLARATASGLDVGAAISELSAPVPLYRFRVALALAKEVAAEVKALGSAMLSALQSADSEELAQLRARQEVRNLDQIRSVRERRIEEAQAAIESLRVAKESAEARAGHYRDLFGEEVPSKSELQIGEDRELPNETSQRESLLEADSQAFRAASNAFLAGFLGLIPSFSVGWSSGPHATLSMGGGNFAAPSHGLAALKQGDASSYRMYSELAGIYATKTRREQDWYLQLRQAELEVTRIEQDLVAAEIRLQLARAELDNHDFSREQSDAVEAYLTRRFTNAELHRWMANELAATYTKAYSFALDLARRAERCFQFELGKPGVTFVRAGQFVGQRKGLLAGNELVSDLQRLEAEYQMGNAREHELVKRVSLAELDPWSLLQLRESGQCEISLDESLFDLDHPGHYFRRVKMVRALTSARRVGSRCCPA